MEAIWCVLTKLFSSLKIKIIWAAILVGLEILIGPINAVLQALAIVVVLDLITGVWAAIRKCEFSSEGLRKLVPKLITYLVLIILAHQAQRVSPIFFILREAVNVFILITEYESVAENIYRATDKKMPSIGFLIDYFRKIKTKMEN